MLSRRDAALAALVFLVALWVNLSAVPTTPFHRDEARWVHRARFLEKLGDPTGAYWRDSELMEGQPPLGSYLMGVGLTVQGRDLDTNGFYNFHFGHEWNRRHGNLPDEVDLAAARRTNSVVGALIAASVYLIASALLNPVAGVAAAALLIPHPLSVYLSSLAGSDALVSLMVAWATLAAMALAQRPTWPRAVLLGVLLGLGGAAKLSPLALALPLAAAGAVLVVYGWRGRGPAAAHDGALGWRLLVQPVFAALTFIATFPYLWPDPVGRTLALLRFRAVEMHNQGVIWRELAIDGPIEALRRIWHWLGEVDSVTGAAIGAVARVFGVAWQPMGLDLALAVAGGVILATLAVQRGLGSRWAMAALVLGGQVALLVFGMRADFSRYLLPVLIATSVGGGLVAGFIGEVAWAWIGPRIALTPKPPSPCAQGEGIFFSPSPGPTGRGGQGGEGIRPTAGPGVTRFATRGGHRLSYESSGDAGGASVLALHDLLGDRGQLRTLAEVLTAAGFRLTLPDARGHGASPLIGGRGFRTSELAADALAVVAAEGLVTTHVVAVGWGAATALGMVHAAPERIASLVLAGLYLPGLLGEHGDAGVRNHLETVKEAAAVAEKGITDRALDLFLGARWGADWQAGLPKSRLAAIRRSAASLGPLLAGATEPADPEALRSIAVPVTLLLREDAPPIERTSAETLAGLLPYARIETVAGELESSSGWDDTIVRVLQRTLTPQSPSP